jgi:hypothetical protein
MAKKLEQIDPRILYASLLIIMVLAIAINLSTEKVLSVAAMFIIVVVALGNIGYIYRRFRK